MVSYTAWPITTAVAEVCNVHAYATVSQIWSSVSRLLQGGIRRSMRPVLVTVKNPVSERSAMAA
ncbi:MAG: hypothetical protein AUK03_10195 [Anaerolineae bacterium CG2_30_64_16]|nr:MAG: hypothetical protein AUK03_10195 [Anaerolineae bacterium CG2_30_64_16]